VVQDNIGEKELDAIKKRLQSHFSDGLVIIVGSGLSCAEGLPSMSDLATCLQDDIPKKLGVLKDEDKKSWGQIDELLKRGQDIEKALTIVVPSSDLHVLITETVSKFMSGEEAKVFESVIKRSTELRFSKLLKHLLKPKTGIPVITTNYDRLIEVASETMGMGVDSLFAGYHIGRFDEERSAMSFCYDAQYKRILNKRPVVERKFINRIKLLKPHGSLDWYLLDGEPVRCPYNISTAPLIIAPGLTKLRTGYDRPFDRHRDKANEYIDAAARYLIIGYGFNDDHLQTHLEHRLKSGIPALVLVHSLSSKARELIAKCENIVAIESAGYDSKKGSYLIDKSSTIHLDNAEWWDLKSFIEEVLGP
jgi:hypothetical protein